MSTVQPLKFGNGWVITVINSNRNGFLRYRKLCLYLIEFWNILNKMGVQCSESSWRLICIALEMSWCRILDKPAYRRISMPYCFKQLNISCRLWHILSDKAVTLAISYSHTQDQIKHTWCGISWSWLRILVAWQGDVTYFIRINTLNPDFYWNLKANNIFSITIEGLNACYGLSQQSWIQGLSQSQRTGLVGLDR